MDRREQIYQALQLELQQTRISRDRQKCLNPNCPMEFVDFSKLGDTSQIVCPRCGKNHSLVNGVIIDREGYSTPYQF